MRACLRECTVRVILAGKSGLWQDALSCLTDLQHARPQPDVVLCSAAIRACSVPPGWEHSLQLLPTLRRGGLVPDVTALNAALHAAGHGGWAAALEALAGARAAAEPDAVSWSTVAAGARRGGGRGRWAAALALLRAAGGSTPSAAPAPTAEEVEAAVQNAADDAGAGEDLEDAAASSGIVSLNAFDLVSHCGGFMLDKMFSPEIFYSVGGGASDQPGPALSADTKKASFSGALLFGGTVKSKTYHFSASAISPHDLTRAVVDALEGMGFDMEGTGGGKDAILHSGVIKCSLLSAKGLVGMFVQVFELSPNMCLLEIRKGKGDLLEWNTAYSELIDKRLAHLLNKAK